MSEFPPFSSSPRRRKPPGRAVTGNSRSSSSNSSATSPAPPPPATAAPDVLGGVLSPPVSRGGSPRHERDTTTAEQRMFGDREADSAALADRVGDLARTQRAQQATEEKAREDRRERRIDRQNFRTDREAKREGRPTITAPSGRRQFVHSDEEWTRQQQEAAALEQRNAEREAEYRRTGRSFYTDRITGEIRPNVPDAEYEKRQKQEAAEQQRRDTERAQERVLDAEADLRPTLTDTDRRRREEQIKEHSATLRDQVLYAYEAHPDFNARSGGILGFGEKPTEASDRLRARYEQLISDPDTPVTDLDLALLPEDSPARGALEQIRGLQQELERDNENHQWHQDRDRAEYLRALEALPGGARTGGQGPAPGKPATGDDPTPHRPDLASVVEDYNTRAQTLQASDQQLAATWDSLQAERASRLSRGISDRDSVLLTTGADPSSGAPSEVWPRDLVPQLNDFLESQAAHFEATEAERQALALAAPEIDAALQQLEAEQQAQREEQRAAREQQFADLQQRAPFLADDIDALRALEAEAEQRAHDISETYEQGSPEQAAAFEELQQDISQRTGEISTRIAAYDQAAAEITRLGLERDREIVAERQRWADDPKSQQTATERQGGIFDKYQALIDERAEAAGLTRNEAGRLARSGLEAAKPWTRGEDTRVLESGRILLNPDHLWSDDQEIARLIARAPGASESARNQALSEIPRQRQQAGLDLLPLLRETKDFQEWENENAARFRGADDDPETGMGIAAETDMVQTYLSERGTWRKALAQMKQSAKAAAWDIVAQTYAMPAAIAGFLSGPGVSVGFEDGSLVIGDPASDRPLVPGLADYASDTADVATWAMERGNRASAAGSASGDVHLLPMVSVGEFTRGAGSIAPIVAGGGLTAGLTRAAAKGTLGRIGKTALKVTGAGGLTRTGTPQALSHTQATNLANQLGMRTASGTAFVQSFGSTYTGARQQYQEAGLSDTAADQAAFRDAALAGLTTMALTRLGGATGPEALFSKGISGGGTRDLAKRLATGTATRKTLHADLKKIGSELFLNASGEAVEEWADETIQGILEYASDRNPDLTLHDVINQGITAGWIGAGLGGGTVTLRETASGAAGAVEGIRERRQQQAEQVKPENLRAARAEIDNFTGPKRLPTGEDPWSQDDIEAAQSRAEALLAIGQGEIATLGDNALATLGLQRDPQTGQIQAKKASLRDDEAELQPVSMVALQEGEPIITEAGLDWLETHFPATRKTIALDEKSRRKQLAEEASNPDYSTGVEESHRETGEETSGEGGGIESSDRPGFSDPASEKQGATPSPAEDSAPSDTLPQASLATRRNLIANLLVDSRDYDPGDADLIAADILARQGITDENHQVQMARDIAPELKRLLGANTVAETRGREAGARLAASLRQAQAEDIPAPEAVPQDENSEEVSAKDEKPAPSARKEEGQPSVENSTPAPTRGSLVKPLGDRLAAEHPKQFPNPRLARAAAQRFLTSQPRDASLSDTEALYQRFQSEVLTSDDDLDTTQRLDEAAAQVETAPTDGQKEAGNYQKGHLSLQGLPITLENPRGSERSGTDRTGKTWSVTMAHHYGYVKRTEGKDGDQVDVFIGPDPESDLVFVIDQIDQDSGRFDEHKVMLGFRTESGARAGYLANYQKGWKIGPLTATSIDDFKTWLRDGDTTKPYATAKPDPKDIPLPKPETTTQRRTTDPVPLLQEAFEARRPAFEALGVTALLPRKDQEGAIWASPTGRGGVHYNPAIADQWYGSMAPDVARAGIGATMDEELRHLATWQALAERHDDLPRPEALRKAHDQVAEAWRDFQQTEPETADLFAELYGTQTWEAFSDEQRALELIRMVMQIADAETTGGKTTEQIWNEVTAMRPGMNEEASAAFTRLMGGELTLTDRFRQILETLIAWIRGKSGTIRTGKKNPEGAALLVAIADQAQAVLDRADGKAPPPTAAPGTNNQEPTTNNEALKTGNRIRPRSGQGDTLEITEIIRGGAGGGRIRARNIGSKGQGRILGSLQDVAAQWELAPETAKKESPKQKLRRELEEEAAKLEGRQVASRQAPDPEPDTPSALEDVNLESTPVLNYLRDNALAIRAGNSPSVMKARARYRAAQRTSKPIPESDRNLLAEYDGQPKQGDYRASVRKHLRGLFVRDDAAQSPDEVAQTLYDAGVIDDATTSELYGAIHREMEAVHRNKGQDIEARKLGQYEARKLGIDAATRAAIAEVEQTARESGLTPHQKQDLLRLEGLEFGPQLPYTDDREQATSGRISKEARSGARRAVAESHQHRGGPPADATERFRAESAALASWAEENGWLIDPEAFGEFLTGLSDRRAEGGVEHYVFFDKGTQRVIKVTKPGTFGQRGTLDGYFDNLERSNAQFGDDIQFVGVLNTPEEGTALVTTQPLVHADQPATEAEIAAFFQETLGAMRQRVDGTWTTEPLAADEISSGRYYDPESGFVIYDARDRNVLKHRKTGELRPIDVLVMTPQEAHLPSIPTGEGIDADTGEVLPFAARPPGAYYDERLAQLETRAKRGEALSLDEQSELEARRDQAGQASFGLDDATLDPDDLRAQEQRDEIQRRQTERLLGTDAGEATDLFTGGTQDGQGLLFAARPAGKQGQGFFDFGVSGDLSGGNPDQQAFDFNLAEEPPEAPPIEPNPADPPETPAKPPSGQNLGDLFNQAKPADKTTQSTGGAIEDFGEKIGGARKDLWTGFREKIAQELPPEDAALTLSKHWPEPNYDKLLEAGANPDDLATMKALRDMVPAKPRAAWKLRRWADMFRILRRAVSAFTGDESSITRERFHAILYDHPEINRKVKLYQKLGYPAVTKAKEWNVDTRRFSRFREHDFGERGRAVTFPVHKGRTLWDQAVIHEESDDQFNPLNRRYQVNPEETQAFDQVTRWVRERILEDLSAPASEKPKKQRQTAFQLYRDRSSGEIYVGKKVRSSVIRVKGGFTEVKDAREYLATEREELERRWEEIKTPPRMRADQNEERTGPDRRGEGDVSPEDFQAAFGFRGVEFGNWVEDKRRQADLNRAYDALMDLADALGIPSQALSLDGSLGLAFGARGTGGRNPAAAHYEPYKVVINLTKKAGPGSLAHEWFHGLDNYFARLEHTGGTEPVALDRWATTMARKPGMPGGEPANVRPEVWRAFGAVRAAVNNGSFSTRSQEFDETRSKPYYGTTIEKAARAFETYVKDRLWKHYDTRNDYLVNIWKTTGEESNPYPTDREFHEDGIKGAYDALFEAMDTRTTDRGTTQLFAARPAQPDPLGFTSGVEQVILDKMPAKASGMQVMGILNPAKSAVKQAEIDWLGIKEWLQSRPDPKDPVLRDELLEFIRQNRVELREVSKGMNDGEHQQDHEVKYRAQAVPGGQNYREILLTLPPKVDNRSPNEVAQERYGKDFYDLTRSQMEEIAGDTGADGSQSYRSSHWDEPNVAVHLRVDDRTDDAGNKVLFIQEIQSDWAGDINKKGVRDEAEIARLKEAEKKASEQYEKSIDAWSDMPAEHASVLYERSQDNNPNPTWPWLPRSEQDQWVQRWENQWTSEEEKVRSLEQIRAQRSETERLRNLKADLQQKISSAQRATPPMPFAKTYHEIGLKRLLRMAIDEGYDKLAWTTGKQQIDIYTEQLRQNVERIEWAREGNAWNKSVEALPNGKFRVTGPGLQPALFATREDAEKTLIPVIRVVAYDKFGDDVYTEKHPLEGEYASKKPLDDVVGKTIANQIRQSAETSGTIEGDNLSIGGHFHKMLYDTAIPSFLKKYTRKWGGRIDRSLLKFPNDTRDFEVSEFHDAPIDEDAIEAGGFTQPSLAITPEMRESLAKTSGGSQPLFAAQPGTTNQEPPTRNHQRSPGETLPDYAANRIREAVQDTAGYKGLAKGLQKLWDSPGLMPFQVAVNAVKKQAVPNHLLDREASAALNQMRIKQAFGQEAALDVVRGLSRRPKFSDLGWPKEYANDHAMRKKLWQAMTGEIAMETLPESIQQIGTKLRRLLDETGLDAVRQGRLHPDTYEAMRENYLPHYYLPHETAQKPIAGLFRRMKLGLDEIRAQRQTGWRIEDRDVISPKDGLPRLILWDEKIKTNRQGDLTVKQGTKWRFRDKQHRDAFYEELVKSKAVEEMQRQPLRAFSAADRNAVRSMDPEKSWKNMEKFSPEIRGYYKAMVEKMRGRFAKERPLTTEEHEKAGLIMDPIYAVSKHVGHMAWDNATAEFFNRVADIGDARGWMAPAPMLGYTQMPISPKLGALSGKFVRDDIGKQVTEMVEAPNELMRFYDGLLTAWKTGKTVYNPGTHGRNVLGNLLFAQFAGINPLNPANAKHYARGLEAIRKGGDTLEEMYRAGVLGGDFLTAELRQNLDNLLPKDIVETEGLDLWARFGLTAAQFYQKSKIKAAKEGIESLYQLEDELFKAAAYLKARAEGMEPDQAAAHVRKWFAYYDHIGTSGSIKLLRRSAMPFFSFQREAIRILGNAARERPVSLATALMAPWFLTLLSFGVLGIGEKDREEILATMRGKGRFFGRDIPLFSMLLPARDREGRLQQFDTTNIMPFASLLGRRREATGDERSLVQSLIIDLISGSPLTGLPVELATNQDFFTGDRITEPNMTTGEKYGAIGDQVAKTLLPPLVPGGTGFSSLANAGERSTNKTLERRNTGQTVARALGGFDLRNASPNVYDLANAWMEENQIERTEITPPGSTPESRARLRVWNEIVQATDPARRGDRAYREQAAQEIAEELAFLRSRGKPIESEQDVNRLLFYRNPAMIFAQDEDRRRFEREWLSQRPEARRTWQAAVSEYDQVLRQSWPLIRESLGRERLLSAN